MIIYGAGSLEDIQKCIKLGVKGILTNPQGFDQYFRGQKTLTEITKSICDITDLPVFIQIHAETTEQLVERAQELNAISPQVGFKIIADEKGFCAIAQLQKQNINCIATTLFSISQAAVAASVGAFGVCPFVSRAAAIGMNPYEILQTMKQCYARLDKAPEIIAVSMKSVADVDLALSAGVDAVGMRYPLLKDMMEHPLSQKAEALFAKNWKNVKGEDISYLQKFMEEDGIAE
jgi:transaldolase